MSAAKRWQLPKRHKPGTQWRILAHKSDPPEGFEVTTQPLAHPETISHQVPGYVFDELAIDSWLHVEQMDDRVWWMRVGDADITVRVGERGEAANVHIRRGDHGDVRGETEL